jgi:hypothetical protein
MTLVLAVTVVNSKNVVVSKVNFHYAWINSLDK